MTTIVPDVSSAAAVFSDAFQFPGRELDPRAPEMIERDRLVMAARPGMLRKLLPLRVDERGVFCGGCYLFDSYDNARAYGDWVSGEFALDGRLFLDRPQFLEPSSQLWQVVAIEDFGDVRTSQQVMRFERWHVPAHIDAAPLREGWWPGIRAAALDAGLASTWLLADPHPFHPQLGLVTTASAAKATASAHPARTRLAAGPLSVLESMPSLGDQLARELDGTKVFDRTSWIYMIWFPIQAGDTSADTALWPCSPALPALPGSEKSEAES